MEAPGFMTVLYLMFTLPQQNGIAQLPGPNWLMAALFVCVTHLITDFQVVALTETFQDYPLSLPCDNRAPFS